DSTCATRTAPFSASTSGQQPAKPPVWPCPPSCGEGQPTVSKRSRGCSACRATDRQRPKESSSEPSTVPNPEWSSSCARNSSDSPTTPGRRDDLEIAWLTGKQLGAERRQLFGRRVLTGSSTGVPPARESAREGARRERADLQREDRIVVADREVPGDDLGDPPADVTADRHCARRLDQPSVPRR